MKEQIKEQMMAVQRMQDHIAENLDREITLGDLARASCFSPWYAFRLFRRALSLTPAEYIRKLRLSRAALRLRDEQCRIIDVAFDMGFGSADGFTRAFYREFGVNPGEYAQSPMPIPLFIPYGVKFHALKEEKVDLSAEKNVFIQVVHKPPRRCIVRRGVRAKDYFPYCEEVGCDVWGLLSSMKSLCGEPVCLWLPQRYVKPNTSVYVQGVEVAMDDEGIIPDGCDVITLPAADYLMFQGEPFEEEDYCEAILSLRRAMDRYDPGVIGYRWDDENPRIQLEPRGARGDIQMRAVTRLDVR